MAKRISREECENLYKVHQTPAHVIGHCRAVAHVALEIGRKLNEHGYDFDLELIEGAGLAHDVARVEEEHWNVGAKILRELGYDDEANIVEVHMHRHVYDYDTLSEMDLVCIGDRLVIEDQYVGLDKRFTYIIDKAKVNYPHRIWKIEENREKLRDLLHKIEDCMGQTIDSLFL
ncbi:MAG: HD domain-containing protein [Firmicutes bacterium]|nr:HD domain-containing protein [Bacillota bacterium]